MEQASYQFSRRLQNVIVMHAGKALYISFAGKHGARYKTNYIILKTVLTFQTLMLTTLGKWPQLTIGFFILGQELLLDYAAWIGLTSNADNSLMSKQRSKIRTHFASLKRVDDLRVYRGFMIPLNHQAG